MDTNEIIIPKIDIAVLISELSKKAVAPTSKPDRIAIKKLTA